MSKVWKQISLRIRIYIILFTLVMITILGGLVMVWYTYRMEGLLTDVIDRNVAGFQTAVALEAALINQKGFVSYYMQDRNPDWLTRLGEYRQIFKERLGEARTIVEAASERDAVNRIEAEYIQYVTLKDRVIDYYKAGRNEEGAQLHKQVRTHFFKVLELCETYKDQYTQKLRRIRDDTYTQAQKLRIVAGSAIFIVLILAVFLAFVLVNNILGPVRRLAMEADRDSLSGKSDDEVKALSRSVRGLIENIGQTQSELERSREHLLQAEKMVVVGQLAAGMAHSIRNPLTSVKMRLFSLHRALSLNPHQKEDFQVISEEILHIDNIVQNFLEFSRPPKLKMQKISPSEIVDLTFKLLAHRLESYNVVITHTRKKILPEIVADPERLKEALVNIAVNACEAMKGGGSIAVDEEEAYEESLGRTVVIRLTDNGPGIPEPIQTKVFEPFFTTKEEGSGLGLSIAARIVQEHGGRLDLTSREGEGTSFAITLPLNPPR